MPAVEKTHAAHAAVVVALVFGLLVVGLLGAVAFLAVRLRRAGKEKRGAGTRYQDEFQWRAKRGAGEGRDEVEGKGEVWEGV